MFHPTDRPMERGWVGRVERDRVVHLAAQTLQHFFTGGGGAREHAEYPLAEVTLLVPVLQPPTVRLFEDEQTLAFGNATAVAGPGAVVDPGDGDVSVHARLAAVVGAEGALGAYSAFLEWRGSAPSAKANDFCLVLGPVVVTDLAPDGAAVALRGPGGERSGVAVGFDWEAARALAARGTTLRPGDVLVGPPVCELDRVSDGEVEVEVEGVGTLGCSLVRPA